jgi:CPA2 family monovalent cation:H+ antiporter-2
LAAGIVSMFATPLLVRAAPHITAGERLLAPLERLIGVRSIDEADEGVKLEGHVVLVGFGVAGRIAARALHDCGRPFVVLELNAESVRQGKRMGLPVYYADATSEEALRHAHVEDARLVVLLMNDPKAAERVVDTVRRVAETVPVLMRARYLAERDALLAMGARDVVAEEVEGAVEILSRTLRRLEVPRNVIDESLDRARAETQRSSRQPTVPRAALRDVGGLGDMKIESALVREESAVAGRSLVDLRFRSETGALVVGVRRGEALLERPDPTVPLEVNDVVYLVGTRDALERAVRLFEACERVEP